MRKLLHLARRFFRSWTSRRPGPALQRLVADVLSKAESEIFWRQPVPDLAHATEGALAIRALHPDRDDLVRAYLLHDVGKRHSRLGTVGRSIATALAMVRLPVTGRMRAYLDHGPIGADELTAAGSDALTIAFARHHTSSRPADVDPADWAILVAADQERLPMR